jgi:glycosyltransferase involved in cell wall biosynthesis
LKTPGKPRILVVSPKYFPVQEGLGHYTTEFCRHLAKVADVAVWTTNARGEIGAASGHPPGRVELIDNVRRWTWGGPFFGLRRALDYEPDRILFQFVPFIYARRGGINFTLVALALLLSARARVRRTGHVEVMFHEIWYPFSWRAKDAVMSVAHRAMAFGVTLSASHTFCSTALFVELVRRNARPFRRRVSWLPVGSNLEREDAPPVPLPPRSDDELHVALFGSAHASKRMSMVLRAIREAARESPRRIRLTVMGVTLDELSREVPDLLDWLANDVDVTGPLEAGDAANRLATQDFLVSYFSDGVSGRRGSLLAALCEGLPVVTTWTEQSDDVFRDRAFVKLFSADEAVFREELYAFLRSTERPFAGVSREDVRQFYRRHFSWAAIVERYCALSGLGPGV